MGLKSTFGRNLLGTAAAVTATAVAGGLATDPRSDWYEGLRKPAWQPPPQAFGLVWTPLYALIAYAGARALTAADTSARAAPAGERARDAAAWTGEAKPARSGLIRALGVNLALNAAWTPLFFRARSPRLALAEIALLNVSTLALVRRFARVDRRAGLALLPYAAWTGFATALNGAIAARNPR
ncbi:tryptophan-rich sensory protein [Streptosporangiaceae bacterium NEAU-GS5]|nr:tryptophan-rich sensory protein [Streptosporangiaceae bacterium NEAU-GS5]